MKQRMEQLEKYGEVETNLRSENDALRADRDRYLARYIKTFEALEDMCYQYLGSYDQPDAFDHACMSAGEGVEQLFFELGVLVEHPAGGFGLAENWREILAAGELPPDNGARTFQQRLSDDILMEYYSLKRKWESVPWEDLTRFVEIVRRDTGAMATDREWHAAIRAMVWVAANAPEPEEA